MEFKRIKTDKLIPAQYNPRKDLKPGDAEFEKIKNSIEEFGYVDPIIINSDYTIIGGHQRFKVLKALGYGEIECIVVEVDKTKEKALNIALNKISGDWDKQQLAAILEELDKESYNIELTGFDFSEAEKLWDEYMEKEEVEEEEIPEVPEESVIEKGDIIQLGPHRLLCGDATSLEDLKLLLEGKKAGLILTDPPYGISYVGKTK